MLRPVRTLLGLVVLGTLVWASFAIPLGGKTLAQHMDAIGATTEAKALVDGTRSTLDPVIDDAKQRVLGEYVEAPTQDTTARTTTRATREREPSRKRARAVPSHAASNTKPPVSTHDATKVPGREIERTVDRGRGQR